MSTTLEMIKKFKENQKASTGSVGSSKDKAQEADVSFRRNVNLRRRSENTLWIFTYSDLITQLLLFFVMLFTMSSVNKTNFSSALKSIQSALKHTESDENKNVPISRLVDDISAVIQNENLEKSVEVDKTKDGVTISLGDAILFKTASPELRGQAKHFLKNFAKILDKINNPIEVIGHTDDQPIKTKLFPTNWELSTARACSVIRYLVDYGELNPDRFVAKGYSEYKPRVENDSLENREKNRRIEIIILQE